MSGTPSSDEFKRLMDQLSQATQSSHINPAVHNGIMKNLRSQVKEMKEEKRPPLMDGMNSLPSQVAEMSTGMTNE